MHWQHLHLRFHLHRAKARKKLDKELLEAKGEESKQTRLRFAADSTNLLFAIYFRILKTMTSDDGEADKFTGKQFRLILRPLFSGLARFGHLMSIGYFQVSYTYLFRLAIQWLKL